MIWQTPCLTVLLFPLLCPGLQQHFQFLLTWSLHLVVELPHACTQCFLNHYKLHSNEGGWWTMCPSDALIHHNFTYSVSGKWRNTDWNFLCSLVTYTQTILSLRQSKDMARGIDCKNCSENWDSFSFLVEIISAIPYLMLNNYLDTQFTSVHIAPPAILKLQ